MTTDSIKQVLDDAEASCSEKLVPVESEIAMLKLRESEFHKAHEGKKDEEIPTTEKDELHDIEKKLDEQKNKKTVSLMSMLQAIRSYISRSTLPYYRTTC